jgi:two-component system, OmpR family, sensor histidine kinase QseC
VADAPSEIGALVTSLNQLFERVHGLIEQERRFTADAAHELRTPLAGIRAQAQVALGTTGDAERAHALDGVIAGCDRATHTVEQMLTLARLAPDAVSFQPTPVELAAVLKGTIGDVAPAALSKGTDIELTHEQHVLVSGDAGLLSILFRNVIDNAIRYSAPGTKVDVDMEVADSDVRVTVRDAGPGIPAEERANVGRRFYRAPGTQAPGTGLGLSIVQRIVDLHHGTIRLDSPASTIGLQVTIALPRIADERLTMRQDVCHVVLGTQHLDHGSPDRAGCAGDVSASLGTAVVRRPPGCPVRGRAGRDPARRR